MSLIIFIELAILWMFNEQILFYIIQQAFLQTCKNRLILTLTKKERLA